MSQLLKKKLWTFQMLEKKREMFPALQWVWIHTGLPSFQQSRTVEHSKQKCWGLERGQGIPELPDSITQPWPGCQRHCLEGKVAGAELLPLWPQGLQLHCQIRHSQSSGRSPQALRQRILHSVRDRITDQRWTPREISLPLKGRGSNKHFSDSNLLLWNPRAKEITQSFATDFRGVRISPLLIWKQVLSATGLQTQTFVMSHSGQTFSFKNW